MKRYIAAAVLTTGLALAAAAPAEAIVIIGGVEAVVGNPDTRVAADGEMNPCIVDARLAASTLLGTTRVDGHMLPCIVDDGSMQPCIAGGAFDPCIVEAEVEVRVTSESDRR